MDDSGNAIQGKAAPLASVPSRRRTRRFWAVVTLSSAAVAAGLFWATRVRWGPPSLERAEALLESQRYGEAEDEASALLEIRSDDPGPLVALARARIGRGDLAGGVAALERVPDWSLRKPLALYFQGKALLDLGRGRQAERVFQQAAARGSALAVSARLELMALYAMEERFEEFRRVFWELYPTASEDERFDLLTLRMRGEFEQVEAGRNAASLQKLLKGDPTDYQAIAGLAATKVHAEDLPEARRLYEQALAEAPDEPHILEGYLDVLHKMGDSRALAEAVEGRPAGLDDRAAIQKFVGIAAQERGDLDAAATAFARAVELDPMVAEYHHRLAQALTLQGKREEAAEEAAKRNALNEADDQLRKAWDHFIIAYESNPEALDVALVDGMARACRASGLIREADAWEREARRMTR